MAAPKGHAKYGGRSAGTPNKATLEIKELARVHGPAGVARLAEIAFGDALHESEAVSKLKQLFDNGNAPAEIAKFARAAFASRAELTCVAAIKELFDRGYGKAVQPIAGDGDGGPIKWEDVTVNLVKTKAQAT